jgi:hypothetical protein
MDIVGWFGHFTRCRDSEMRTAQASPQIMNTTKRLCTYDNGFFIVFDALYGIGKTGQLSFLAGKPLHEPLEGFEIPNP